MYLARRVQTRNWGGEERNVEYEIKNRVFGAKSALDSPPHAVSQKHMLGSSRHLSCSSVNIQLRPKSSNITKATLSLDVIRYLSVLIHFPTRENNPFFSNTCSKMNQSIAIRNSSHLRSARPPLSAPISNIKMNALIAIQPLPILEQGARPPLLQSTTSRGRTYTLLPFRRTRLRCPIVVDILRWLRGRLLVTVFPFSSAPVSTDFVALAGRLLARLRGV